jgi:hypothetical protein
MKRVQQVLRTSLRNIAVCLTAVALIAAHLSDSTLSTSRSTSPSTSRFTSHAQLIDSSSPDYSYYASQIRTQFSLSTSDVSDQELQTILHSPNGAWLDSIIDGLYAAQNLCSSKSAYSSFVNLLYRDTGILSSGRDVVIQAADDLAHFLPGLTGAAISASIDAYKAYGSIQLYADTFATLSNFPDCRYLWESYVSLRQDYGEDPATAMASLESDYGPVVNELTQAFRETDDAFFTNLETQFQALRYSFDPELRQNVRSFVLGLAAAQCFYSTDSASLCGYTQGDGLVVLPQDADTVIIVNDGPYDVQNIHLIGNAGQDVLQPVAQLAAHSTTYAYTSSPTASLSDASYLQFDVLGMSGLTVPFSTANSTLWAGNPTATPDRDVARRVDFSFDPHPVSIYYQATTIAWDFGDHTGESGTEAAEADTSHDYVCSGTYTATATVKAGASIVARTVGAIVQPPYQLTWTTSDGAYATQPNVPITFNVSDQVPPGVSVTWDFGDGTNPVKGQRTVTHAFATKNVYHVTVSAPDSSLSCPSLAYTNDVYVGQSTDWLTLPSVISHDRTLTAAYAGYIISSGLTVKKGVTLTIDPGVNIKFSAPVWDPFNGGGGTCRRWWCRVRWWFRDCRERPWCSRRFMMTARVGIRMG